MGEAKRRAALRAAGVMQPPKLRISNRIDVVPMEHTDSYLKYEVLSEGQYRSNVPLVVIRPAVDSGLASERWLSETRSRMREVRARAEPQTVKIAGMDLDIGLIDIIVFVEMAGSKSFVHPGSREESDRLLQENLRHIDMLCADALHDQMVIAIAPHIYHSKGSLLYHYHNLVFGLRQEVREDGDILGTLDMEPLMKRLSSSGGLNIIGGIRQ